MMATTSNSFAVLALSAATALAAGCGDTFINLTSSLGGSRAGSRGDVRVVFINNTSFRPVFTFGTFDQTDPDYRPDVAQFVLDGEEEEVLAPNSSTEVGALDCARIFSIGSPRLLALIERNLDVELDENAFVEGIAFYQADGAVESRAGDAEPFEALLGIDFPCESLLIIRLEESPTGAPRFHVDFELIPSTSTR